MVHIQLGDRELKQVQEFVYLDGTVWDQQREKSPGVSQFSPVYTAVQRWNLDY